MNVISKRGLKQQIEQHQDCAAAALAWYRVARKAEWTSLEEVRREIASTDQVGRVLIFNLRGNAYRLIVGVNWPSQRLYVKALLSHTEYDKKEWMKWA